MLISTLIILRPSSFSMDRMKIMTVLFIVSGGWARDTRSISMDTDHDGNVSDVEVEKFGGFMMERHSDRIYGQMPLSLDHISAEVAVEECVATGAQGEVTSKEPILISTTYRGDFKGAGGATSTHILVIDLIPGGYHVSLDVPAGYIISGTEGLENVIMDGGLVIGTTGSVSRITIEFEREEENGGGDKGAVTTAGGAVIVAAVIAVAVILAVILALIMRKRKGKDRPPRSHAGVEYQADPRPPQSRQSPYSAQG